MGEPWSITAMAERDRRLSEIIAEQRSRLRNFIRRRVPDPSDAEDIVQEVFYELVEANRLLMPIEHVTGWLFRVSRNRITDLFRRKNQELFSLRSMNFPMSNAKFSSRTKSTGAVSKSCQQKQE
jgi:RNA polymerase sigma factor (sigma-70 family)